MAFSKSLNDFEGKGKILIGVFCARPLPNEGEKQLGYAESVKFDLWSRIFFSLSLENQCNKAKAADGLY